MIKQCFHNVAVPSLQCGGNVFLACGQISEYEGWNSRGGNFFLFRCRCVYFEKPQVHGQITEGTRRRHVQIMEGIPEATEKPNRKEEQEQDPEVLTFPPFSLGKAQRANDERTKFNY